VDDGTKLRRHAQRPSPRRRVRVHRELGRAVLLFPRTRRRSPPKGRDLRETNKEPRRRRKHLESRTTAPPASNYFGAPPNLFSNRATFTARHELQCRCVCVRRGSSKKGPRSHARTRRRGLRLLGRTRRLIRRCSHTDLKPRTGTSREIPAHGRGLQAGHRLQGPVFSSSQTERPTKHQYDSDAGRLPEFLREFDLPTTSNSTSKPITPRWPATRCSTNSPSPLLPADSARSTQPRRRVARLDTDSFRPTFISRRRSCSLFSAWADSNPGD